MMPPVATDPEIERLIAANAAVAIGVSGGKDSQAAAIATMAHLDSRGHSGPRVLIHSDLGSVEWNDSLPACQRLAAALGLELVVVRRISGDMMQRWEARQASSERRYANLESVTLILPWSTPSMRFCTSELKTKIIEAELKRRFKGSEIVNVTGVRRQESAARAKGSVASKDSSGNWSWRPISDWSTAEVFASIAAAGMKPHQGYTEYGLSRVSCRFCIMSSAADLNAAVRAAEAQDIFLRMVELEARSTFGFQGNRWLADIAPHLLGDDLRVRVAEAKDKAALRMAAEKAVTKEMRFTKGWPTRMLTDDEADILASVRRTVSGLIGIEALYLDRQSIHDRYASLIAAREEKEGRLRPSATAPQLKPIHGDIETDLESGLDPVARVMR